MENKCKLCEFSAYIAKFSDTHTILETILTQARKISSADAGTIYLCNASGMLEFAYMQNDTLFPNEQLAIQESLRSFVNANIQALSEKGEGLAKAFCHTDLSLLLLQNDGTAPVPIDMRLELMPVYSESAQYQGVLQCAYLAPKDTVTLVEKNIKILEKKALQICEHLAENDTDAIQTALIQFINDIPCDMICFYDQRLNKTFFAFSQENKIIHGTNLKKLQYLKVSLPINEFSITGYVASTMESLNIPDVHLLSPELPYHFNASFDKKNDNGSDNKAQYRTVSMLTLPLIGPDNLVLGVLQLINATHSGEIIPFSVQVEEQVVRMALLASSALERGAIAEESILRMNRTAALKDPAETTNHVIRVGYIAAEIYAQWAENNGIPYEVIRQERGTIRLAAMLHDIGKVGIPDAVLKKPGAFIPAERAIMEQHSFLGSDLFVKKNNRLDTLARNICLHHHQKWNGKGYTGSVLHPVLSGADIPLEARIVAIADVYDALRSKRCYKPEWAHEDVMEMMQNESGIHFDPELIDVFFQIQNVALGIFEKYYAPSLP